MNNTDQLRDLGQRLWLDGLDRGTLDAGGLRRDVQELSITGVNCDAVTIDEAMGLSDAGVEGMRAKAGGGSGGPDIHVVLALEDLSRVAALLQAAWDASAGLDGWVSMGLSPLLAHDAAGTTAAAGDLHRRAVRPNLMVAIPGTTEGLAAIEDCIFAGIPVNASLLFSAEQYRSAALAYLRGIERRLEAGRDPTVGCVASVVVSPWDEHLADRVTADRRNQLGIAIARRTHRVYRELLATPRWLRLAAAGARPQRLLWTKTATRDPQLSESWYVEALAAPDTIVAMSQRTLRAFAAKGRLLGAKAAEAGNAEATLARIVRAGIDIDALAEQLQVEAVAARMRSWENPLRWIGVVSEAPERGSAA
jgi:transaldolase